jgi:hypothetical protein
LDGSNISHTVTTNEKNTISRIQITTILSDMSSISNNFDFEINAVTDHITSTDGFSILNLLGNADALSIRNTLWYGIRKFSFTMAGTRLFLLDNTDVTDFRLGLQENDNMNFIGLSIFYMADPECTDATDTNYYTDTFTCVPPSDCTDIIEDTTNNLCHECDATCDGCAGINYAEVKKCTACATGNNRIQDASGVCVCDAVNGYVDTGSTVCPLCSDYIEGCIACTNTS